MRVSTRMLIEAVVVVIAGVWPFSEMLGHHLPARIPDEGTDSPESVG